MLSIASLLSFHIQQEHGIPRHASWPAPPDHHQLPPSLEALEARVSCWADGFDLFQAHPSPPNPTSYSAAAHLLTRSPPLTNDATPDNHAATATANRVPRTVKRLRRQNHACDPCPTSKKACDLARGAAIRNGKVAVPCTSCTARHIDCTASWLWSKLRRRNTRGDAEEPAPAIACQTPKPTETKIDNSLGSVPRLESSLCRTTVANVLFSQFFNHYIDMAETFLSQCVLRGSMPLQYKLGVAAYDNLSTHSLLATCVQRVEQWVASCWQGSTAGEKILPLNPGPHIFRNVCLLDAFFGASVSGSARNTALTATFKWVAIATAVQVNIHDDDEQIGRSDEARARKHDILRFLHYSGSITVRGIDISQIPLSVLQTQISVLPSELPQFPGTVEQTYYLRDSTETLKITLTLRLLKRFSNISTFKPISRILVVCRYK